MHRVTTLFFVAATMMSLAFADRYFDKLGDGCPGTGGVVPQVSINSAARLGNQRFEIVCSNAHPNSQALLYLGFDDQQYFGVRLPVVIGQSQGVDCALRVAPVLITPIPTNAMGTATFPLPLPNNPALNGLELFVQWFPMDPGGLNGFSTTAGGRIRLRTD